MPLNARRYTMKNRIGSAAFIDSSMNGATVTATMSSESFHRSNSAAALSLTSRATLVATPAPHRKQDTTIHSGDGWYRSSHRKQATSAGTGGMAPAMPT